jgi:uncharacterized protein (TIGR03118 family)
MHRHIDTGSWALRSLLLAATCIAVAGCGGSSGGYGSNMPAAPTPTDRFTSTALISDQPGAAHLDARLVDPWELTIGGGSALWLTNHGSASSSLYNAADLSLPALLVAAPAGNAGSARPTAAAFNPANGFEIMAGGHSGVARFIVASDGGTLSGWAPSLASDLAVVGFDAAAANAVYTGLIMRPQGVESVLLATDFRNGSVETFDAGFKRQLAGGRFADPQLPAGFAPFGIAAFGGLVYVAYGKPDASGRTPQAGAGLGLVNVFDETGRLVRRLIDAGGALNAPWSMVIAPADFGMFSGALLVANAGDGTITAFDVTSGRPLGSLARSDGTVLAIDGLHGIAFGNGAQGLPLQSLFFTAGPQGGRHGVFGRIDRQ